MHNAQVCSKIIFSGEHFSTDSAFKFLWSATIMVHVSNQTGFVFVAASTLIWADKTPLKMWIIIGSKIQMGTVRVFWKQENKAI